MRGRVTPDCDPMSQTPCSCSKYGICGHRCGFPVLGFDFRETLSSHVTAGNGAVRLAQRPLQNVFYACAHTHLFGNNVVRHG